MCRTANAQGRTRQYDLALVVLEELGDDALASGDKASAGQAYFEAAWIATEEAQRRESGYDVKQVETSSS